MTKLYTLLALNGLVVTVLIKDILEGWDDLPFWDKAAAITLIAGLLGMTTAQVAAMVLKPDLLTKWYLRPLGSARLGKWFST
jgi:hypothetical protein